MHHLSAKQNRVLLEVLEGLLQATGQSDDTAMNHANTIAVDHLKQNGLLVSSDETGWYVGQVQWGTEDESNILSPESQAVLKARFEAE